MWYWWVKSSSNIDQNERDSTEIETKYTYNWFSIHSHSLGKIHHLKSEERNVLGVAHFVFRETWHRHVFVTDSLNLKENTKKKIVGMLQISTCCKSTAFFKAHYYEILLTETVVEVSTFTSTTIYEGKSHKYIKQMYVDDIPYRQVFWF